MEKPTLDLEKTEIQILLAGLDIQAKDQQRGGLAAMDTLHPIAAKLSKYSVELEKQSLREMIAEEDEQIQAKKKAENELKEKEEKAEATRKALEVVKELTETQAEADPKGVTKGPPNKNPAAKKAANS